MKHIKKEHALYATLVVMPMGLPILFSILMYKAIKKRLQKR